MHLLTSTAGGSTSPPSPDACTPCTALSLRTARPAAHLFFHARLPAEAPRAIPLNGVSFALPRRVGRLVTGDLPFLFFILISNSKLQVNLRCRRPKLDRPCVLGLGLLLAQSIPAAATSDENNTPTNASSLSSQESADMAALILRSGNEEEKQRGYSSSRDPVQSRYCAGIGG